MDGARSIGHFGTECGTSSDHVPGGLRRVDGGCRLQVEVGEVLEPREASLGDAALAASGPAVVELG